MAAREQAREEAREVASGIARLEGYLLWQAETRTARAEAEAFAAGLPWLTAEQREEVVRRYAEERIGLSRRVLEAVAGRCRELRAEYTERYVLLRRRLLCLAGSAVLLAVAVSACGVLQARLLV